MMRFPLLHRLFCFLCLFVCIGVLVGFEPASAEPKTIPLWPSDALEHHGDGDVPTLIVNQVASERPTAAVVILPGGGYRGHAMDHEGHQFAEWFGERGVTSAICVYRLRGKGNQGKGYGHPYPMLDAQRALQTLRANAEELNVDPNRIGVIGFSAGGHLCSTVSNHFAEPKPDSSDPIARVSSRPDFAILCYPVIAFDQSFTHRGSQRNLLGDQPDPKLVALLSNEKQVTDQTPPSFLFHTNADRVVPVRNSLVYFEACQKAGVPVEMHLFQEGRHGLGLARQQPGADQWPKMCEMWLRRQGIVTLEKDEP